MNPLQQAQAEAAQALVRQGTLRGRELRSLLLSVPATERESFVDTLLGLPEAPPDDPGLRVAPCPICRRASMKSWRWWPRCRCPLTIASSIRCGSRPCRPLGPPLVLGPSSWRRRDPSSTRGSGTDLCSGPAAGGVTFQCADAASVRLEGSVFFLYSPFSGATLHQVLMALRCALAEQQAVVVVTVGLELPGEAWLRRRSTSLPSLTIYESEGTIRAPAARARGAVRAGHATPQAQKIHRKGNCNVQGRTRPQRKRVRSASVPKRIPAKIEPSASLTGLLM